MPGYSAFIRFEVACQAKDIVCLKLMRAIIHVDLGMKPSIPHRVYIMNKRIQTIYYVYGDRGCDVLGSHKEKLKSLYHQYNAWILDYDRKIIVSIFLTGPQECVFYLTDVA